MFNLNISSAKTHRELDKITSNLLTLTRNNSMLSDDMRSALRQDIMKQYRIAEKTLAPRLMVTKHVD